MLPGTESHPHARAVLRPEAPRHAYLFHGPAGAGKRAVAREFAAALLAGDDEGARARVLSGAHPDLTWVPPSGAAEMLVGDIAPAAARPRGSAATSRPSWRLLRTRRSRRRGASSSSRQPTGSSRPRPTRCSR